jgi:tetratricopeptide (TPR) repeat protein
MDIRDGLRDDKGALVGPIYLGRIVNAFDKRLKSYEGWAECVPDDAEAHLCVAGYLQDQYEKTKDDRLLKSAMAERRKGIAAGENEVAKGEPSAMVLYLMGDAYRVDGDLDKSAENLQKAVNLRPKKTEWGLTLARVQMTALAAAQKRAEQAQAAGDAETARKETIKARDYLTAAAKSVENVLSFGANSDALDMSRAIGERRGSLAP